MKNWSLCDVVTSCWSDAVWDDVTFRGVVLVLNERNLDFRVNSPPAYIKISPGLLKFAQMSLVKKT